MSLIRIGARAGPVELSSDLARSVETGTMENDLRNGRYGLSIE